MFNATADLFPPANQTVAAAATELWPSIANTFSVPWTIGRALPTKSTSTRKTSGASASPTAVSTTSPSTQQAVLIPATPQLPDFLKNASLSQSIFSSDVSKLAPTNIISELSNMSPRSPAMANPLVLRSFSALVSRPLGVMPSMRAMSTYRTVRHEPLRWAVPVIAVPVLNRSQYRGFGSAGVSRNILASRESLANQIPTSASAQNAFYQALLKANMPAIVVERYQSGKQCLSPCSRTFQT